ncbi:MAG: sulfotransferase family 2 domain-containing protein [Gammaproteobacteria bacterium]
MLISVHIPKTGGATFQKLLQQHFADSYYGDYDDIVIAGINYRPKIVRSTLDRLRYCCADKHKLIRSNVSCIHGHFLATKYDRWFPGNRKAAWLRDPLQRVISHYKYWQRSPSPKNPIYVDLMNKGFGFQDFVKEPRLQNLQTRYLDGTDLEEYLFVGLMEEYQKSLDLFKRILAIDPDLNVARLNMNPERKSSVGYELEQMDGALLEEFAELNREDFMLYQKARRVFDRLCTKCLPCP